MFSFVFCDKPAVICSILLPNSTQPVSKYVRFAWLFIAPSRDLDLRQQLPSLDETFAEPKYRTPSPANFLGECCRIMLLLSLLDLMLYQRVSCVVCIRL